MLWSSVADRIPLSGETSVGEIRVELDVTHNGDMKAALKTNKFAPCVLRDGVARAPSGCDQTAAHHNGRWLRSDSGASGACDADCASSPAKAPSWLSLGAQGPPYDGERQCPAPSGR